jgi:peptidoglycan/LPS O-acetylase OafA/YrhL
MLAIGCAGLSVLGRCLDWPASLLLTRTDGLVMGGMIAAILHRGSLSRLRAGWLFGSMIVLGCVGAAAIGVTLGLSSRQLAVSGPGLLAINTAGTGVIGIAVTFAQARWLAPLRLGVFTYLGKISYGLYLYHYVILRISAGQLRLWAPWEMPAGRQSVTILLCFVAASLSWVLIEQPILKLKGRFAYAKRGPEPRADRDSHSRPIPARSRVWQALRSRQRLENAEQDTP